ncbi:hypothetical protein NVP1244A_008 [Vibrio phage 1.244.A._10N.261.54.C3]|nr:hypothetical protein NVP1244A_008 [Vibrio phage 1.244.A._10N.261.54.C3]AUR98636.1 hypothetical protein NVP1255O_008 [Vibrio phage 1.255.O._10N.286.45.F1]
MSAKLKRVVDLVGNGQLTEARKIVRESLDERKEELLEAGKAYIAGSIKPEGKKKPKKDEGDTPSHDGGAD